MPNYLERSDIPGPLYRALTDNSYAEGLREYYFSLSPEDQAVYKHSNLSVTSLANSPRQRILAIRHNKEIVVDPMDRMFALYGTMMHATLEKYANPDEGDLVERRLGFRVGNTWVHGQADLYEPASKTISDYKITSVESALYSDHYEHICQLNVLRYIFRLHGYKVEKTRNIYIYRNWARRDVNREGYPQEIIQEIEVPVWSDEEVMAYIKGRVETHDAASQLPDDDLPHCTPKERWERPTHWRVFKLDPKTGERQSRAKLRTENQSEVETFIDKTLDLEYEAAVEKNSALKTERAKKTPEQMLAGLSKYETVKYPGRAVKCAFCDSANFCSQRLAELEIISNQTEEDEE